MIGYSPGTLPRASFVLAALVLSSCGGSSDGSGSIPTAPAPVVAVTIAPATATLAIGTTQQLTATTLSASGSVLTGRAVTWTSSDSTKVKVSSSGLATAVAAGTATVTATSEGGSGTATIAVTDPGNFEVRLVGAPSGVGGVLIALSGGAITAVAGVGFEERHVIAADGRSATMLVRGALSNGVVARITVPDRSLVASYVATVQQLAASGTYKELPTSGVTVVLVVVP